MAAPCMAAASRRGQVVSSEVFQHCCSNGLSNVQVYDEYDVHLCKAASDFGCWIRDTYCRSTRTFHQSAPATTSNFSQQLATLLVILMLGANCNSQDQDKVLCQNVLTAASSAPTRPASIAPTRPASTACTNPASTETTTLDEVDAQCNLKRG